MSQNKTTTYIKKPELTPLENDRARVSHQQDVAAGLPAVFSSFNHARKDNAFVKGTFEFFHMNQKHGFDCPSCAWPDPDGHRSSTEFCENGAKAVAEETTGDRVTPEFFAKHSVNEIASWSDYEIGKSGRITHPMVLRENATHYEPISWQSAFDLLASELNALQTPDEAIFYTSGRTSNEAAFAYQLFARLFGTNNLPDCSNMCHESSTVAMTEAIGIGKATMKLEDFEKTDCIVMIGHNPGTNHPRMLTHLEIAAKNGAKIITINPMFETGTKAFIHPQHFWKWFGPSTKLSCLHLPVRMNGDIAVLKGLMKEMLAAEEATPGTIFDHDFIKTHTDGFSDFVRTLKSESWDLILQESGLTRENIKAAADIIMHSKKMIVSWAMGITQQQHGVHAIREIVNLLALGGNFGREGAGACPVRGHSNVQGDRTMGIYEKPTKEFLDRLGKEFNFEPAREHGLDTVNSVKAMLEGKAKVFFAMGGNFLSAVSDTEAVAEALRKTNLTVHVSTKPNRSHVVHGKQALILPCLGRTEHDMQEQGAQFVTVENTTCVISMSKGNLKPASEHLKSEVAIVCDMAKAVFREMPEKRDTVKWDELKGSYDNIRSHIEKVVVGFNNFNERVRHPGGFYLAHAVRDQKQFATPKKKLMFYSRKIEEFKIPPGQLILATVRSHDQFNTTIYGMADRYRGIHGGRRVIFMNEEDIRERGLTAGQWVDLQSEYEGKIRMAPKFMVVAYEIPRKCVAAYYPETNVLVPLENNVEKSNTPVYKTVMITVRPSIYADETKTAKMTT